MDKNVLYLGEDRFSIVWLKGVTEKQAVNLLKGGHQVGQIRNAWKQANGFSVPKYDSTEKPTPKKVKKKEAKD
jgi:hypothetical protein